MNFFIKVLAATSLMYQPLIVLAVFWANQAASPDVSSPMAAPIRPARAEITDAFMTQSPNYHLVGSPCGQPSNGINIRPYET